MVGGRTLGAGEQRGWGDMKRRSLEVQRALVQRLSSPGPQRCGRSCGDGPDWCRGAVGTRGARGWVAGHLGLEGFQKGGRTWQGGEPSPKRSS